MAMTIYKWRRLQQTAGPKGTFAVAAVDHRGPLRRSLEKEVSHGETNEALTELKRDIVRHLAPATTAVLLDPETGARDPAVLRSVAQRLDADAGVYATVKVQGTIRVGDPIFA